MLADSTDARPSKRKTRPQDDSSVAISSHALKHHPHFWFNDGTIVIVAQRTGFRIFRGLLASQSTVFADMITASSSSSGETLDGYPVVHLSDSPQDLAHLLGVLLPTSHIHYHMPRADQPRPFDEVSAVIRLADKYHIESLQDHALRVLQRHHFTSDFAAFTGPPDPEITVEPVHAIGAVNLARLTDTPHMLPLALYRCCLLDDAALLAGWKRADGTVEHLTLGDFKRCTGARARLLELHASLHTSLVESLNPSRGCANPFAFGWLLGLRVRREFLALLPDRIMGCDVFHGWVALVARQMRWRHQCEACVGELVRRTWEDRRTIWDALPEIFGVAVDGWKSPEGGAPPGP